MALPRVLAALRTLRTAAAHDPDYSEPTKELQVVDQCLRKRAWILELGITKGWDVGKNELKKQT